jgi:class 3 adenylate cyclase
VFLLHWRPFERDGALEATGGARRLAAILAADVVGCAGSWRPPRGGTLARLETHRFELADPPIAGNPGRIVETMRMNPYHPDRFVNHLGRARYTVRRYPEAVAALSRIARPDHGRHALLAAPVAHLGDSIATGARAQEALKRSPGFSIRRHLLTLHYRLERDRERLRGGVQNAGLPA